MENHKANIVNPEENDIIAIYESAVGLEQSGDYHGAIAAYNRVIEIDSSYAEVYYSRGISKHQIEDYQGAIFDYTEAIKIGPSNSNVYNNRGLAFSQIGFHKSAIADLTEALRLNPDDADCYYNRGLVYEAIADYEKAIVDYTEALKINPGYYLADERRKQILVLINSHLTAVVEHIAGQTPQNDIENEKSLETETNVKIEKSPAGLDNFNNLAKPHRKSLFNSYLPRGLLINGVSQIFKSIFPEKRNQKLIKIINHEQNLAMIFLIAMCSFLIFRNLNRPRLLILHSYAKDYSWVNDQNEGMQRIFQDKQHILYKEYYLDTKNKPYSEYMERAGREARELIKRWKPDLIIACDDDAQKLVAKHFVNDPDLKIVFTGIQGHYKKYGYDRANNVTGIFEKVSTHGVKETLIALNQNQEVKLTRIFHLSDKSTYSQFVKTEITSFDWQPFKLVNSSEYKTFEDWKNAIKKANNEADILLITNYHTIRRSAQDKSIVTPKEIIEWTEANSTIPGIGCWGFYVEDGGTLAVGVSPYEQGETAAKIAVDILVKKIQIQKISPQTGRQYIVYMRKTKMEEHELKLPPMYEAFARATNHYFE